MSVFDGSIRTGRGLMSFNVISPKLYGRFWFWELSTSSSTWSVREAGEIASEVVVTLAANSRPGFSGGGQACRLAGRNLERVGLGHADVNPQLVGLSHMK